MLAWIFDYALVGYFMLIGFMRFMVGPEFFPQEVSSFFFSEVSYLGFSSTPRLFWIGFLLLLGSLGTRLIYRLYDQLPVFSEGISSSGEAYLERHNINRVDD